MSRAGALISSPRAGASRRSSGPSHLLIPWWAASILSASGVHLIGNLFQLAPTISSLRPFWPRLAKSKAKPRYCFASSYIEMRMRLVRRFVEILKLGLVPCGFLLGHLVSSRSS